ncbi:unnamed protein product [Camellia sinensis]
MARGGDCEGAQRSVWSSKDERWRTTMEDGGWRTTNHDGGRTGSLRQRIEIETHKLLAHLVEAEINKRLNLMKWSGRCCCRVIAYSASCACRE